MVYFSTDLCLSCHPANSAKHTTGKCVIVVQYGEWMAHF